MLIRRRQTVTSLSCVPYICVYIVLYDHFIPLTLSGCVLILTVHFLKMAFMFQKDKCELCVYVKQLTALFIVSVTHGN